MRIAHVTDGYLPRLGGIELQVHDLATRQREAGHQTVVITSTGGPGTSTAFDPPVLRLGSAFGQPTPTALAEVAAVVRGGRYDVVHAHTSVFSPLAWSAARAAGRAGTPCVLTMHSVVAEATRALTAPMRLVGPGAERRPVWTAVSGMAAASLGRTLPGEPVGVLPNGIDPDLWTVPARRSGDGPLTLVSVLRLARRKRPMALLRTLRTVRELVPDDVPLRAVLVGSGPMESDVRRGLARFGLDEWVELPGRCTREQIRALYSRSDLYLAPATLESFGIAALEARCAGLPVVAMACGGVGDFLDDGVGGVLVEDDRQMAHAAAALLVDDDRRRAMHRHHRTTVPTMTWDAIVPATIDLYAAAGGTTRWTTTMSAATTASAVPAMSPAPPP